MIWENGPSETGDGVDSRDRAAEADGLVKVYGDGHRALDGLDLRAAAGQVYGLVGRNGAGKSTAIGCLLGLLRPTDGRAMVLGLDLREAAALDRARVAAVLQEPRLQDTWTGWDLMRERAQVYPRWDADLAGRLATRFDLQGHLGRPTGSLSGGQRRALTMLLALACRPELLVLDEPAASLDPIARRALLDALVQSLAEDRPPTVLLSSHVLGDLERLADRVGIMDRGRMLVEDSLDALRERFQRAQWIFAAEAPVDFQPPVRFHDLRREGRLLSAVIEVRSAAELAALRAVPGAHLDLFSLSLEDVFVAVLGTEHAPHLDEAIPDSTGEPVGSDARSVLR
ncbi:MAG: ABC transporter ATP-binding protein [Ardenticatenia bacterium]|nr:ABC transporter ATP-binding protein [Ardenticatenia bacterium]